MTDAAERTAAPSDGEQLTGESRARRESAKPTRPGKRGSKTSSQQRESAHIEKKRGKPPEAPSPPLPQTPTRPKGSPRRAIFRAPEVTPRWGGATKFKHCSEQRGRRLGRTRSPGSPHQLTRPRSAAPPAASAPHQLLGVPRSTAHARPEAARAPTAGPDRAGRGGGLRPAHREGGVGAPCWKEGEWNSPSFPSFLISFN